MKIEIKCRFSGKIIFEHNQEGNTVKITVEAAVKAGASLAGASLAGASLAGANLAGANLAGAYLAGANLARANLADASLARANLADANLARAYLAGASLARAYLAGANLARANLAGASLAGASLAGASLAGAYLANGEKLQGKRPILQIGPIGSRCAYFVAYMTTRGVLVSAGCFREKTIAEFREKLADEHGENKHAQEYQAALAFIEKHAELWGETK